MGAIASIVVPDAAATPVNHTFVPQNIEGNTARWTEKTTATIPMGFWQLDSTLREPVNGGKAYRYTLNLGIPKLKTYTDINGNPVTIVDYIHRAQVVLLLPENGTLQDRKDLRKLLVGLLNDASQSSQVESLDHVY